MRLTLLAHFAALAAATPTLRSVTAIEDDVIAKVRTNLLKIATHSWERGVAVETLSELDSPNLSVFGDNTIPPAAAPKLNGESSSVMLIANQTISALTPTSATLFDKDSAIGDPASLGVAILQANWTQQGSSGTFYSKPAEKQLDHLLLWAPRSPSGAISHRSDQVQLWADFVYMGPPFIAYYGAIQGGDYGKSLMQEAYTQCRLYRDVLRDDSGLWQHVLLGKWNDTTHWATGNAWAAGGMLRVLQTFNKTSSAADFADQSVNLVSWINEILDNTWKFQTTNGTLLNVLDDPKNFADTASTAMIAAITYRMAVVTGDSSRIPFAEKAFGLIKNSIDNEGWLLNPVDPMTFHSPIAPGQHSPEGQAFVLQLHAAQRDYNTWLQTRSQ